jgi:F plasmid transfer operon, TraF, protein
MTKRCLIIGLTVIGLIATPLMAAAVEFAVVGARAAGMGGAGVAVTTDAYAIYWNPAGLAMTKTIDFRVGFSAQAFDRLGVLDTIQEVNRGTTSNAQATALMNRINQPGFSLSAIGTAGLFMKGYYGEHAVGFAVSDIATGGAFTSSPATISLSGTAVNAQFAIRGLEARQAAFSYAYAFADRTFSIGVTGKVIQGAAYSSTATIQGSAENIGLVSDNLGKAKTSTAFGIDVGALYRPSSWLRLGIVAKDINQPTFDAPGGGEVKLTPQVRGGVAVNPWETLTLTVDADVNTNHTLVPGIKSRMISAGAEQTIFSEFLSLRLGAYKNTADANSYITPTAGFGLRIFALRVDFGAGYDFRERGVLGSGSVSMTF